jgi:oxygen-dependent protoporphyrinogen oxidase
MSEEAIANLVESEVSAVLGISGLPVDRMVWKHPKALPRFQIGHAQRVREIRRDLSALPGLRLAGNYLEGRSIGDCVDLAFGVAEDIAADREVPLRDEISLK